MTIRNKIKKGVIVGLAGTLMGGCAGMTSEQAAVLGLLMQGAAINNPDLTLKERATAGAVSEFLYTESQNKSRKEAARKGNVRRQKDLRRKIQPELLAFHRWNDLDGNGKAAKRELFGLGKKVFNLDREQMAVGFYSGDYSGDVRFRSWTETGKLIGETTLYVNRNRLCPKYAGPKIKPSSPPDFMDELQDYVTRVGGSGNYRITADTEDGQTYIIDVEIINDKSSSGRPMREYAL